MKVRSPIKGLKKLQTMTKAALKRKLRAIFSADVQGYSKLMGDDAVDKNLGQGYRWNPGSTITGGTLHHEGQSVALVRNQSTRNTAGSWI